MSKLQQRHAAGVRRRQGFRMPQGDVFDDFGEARKPREKNAAALGARGGGVGGGRDGFAWHVRGGETLYNKAHQHANMALNAGLLKR